MRALLFAAAMAVSLLAGGTAAEAQDLTIGLSTETSAIDPHFSRTGNNQMISRQIFDRLAEQDENLQIKPGLAEKWENIDPTTWRVTLRADAKFSDGTPVTSEDVIYSLERIPDVPNSPAPFTANVANIASMTAIDDRTIEFKTKTPMPQFMEVTGLAYIVSKAATEGKTLEDFNSGEAAIGSGAYKLQEYVPGSHLTLVRNEHYWGEPGAFETVTYRVIGNDAARVAALRSGDVDLIDAVPPNMVESLSAIEGLKVFTVASTRLIYLGLDSDRDASPFITDASGAPLDKNPLKDPRVRQAMSLMIDRQLLIDRILQGSGEPAGQMVSEGMGGHDPELQPDAPDLARAKELLAEAGYPEGFGLTIHSSNDRFAGDADLAQALGQMFARGGLKVNGVVTLPYNVYAGAATNLEYSVFVFSIGNSTPSSGPSLQNVLMTNNKEAGTGSFNRGRYSNPEFDAKVSEALAEFDETRRDQLLREATRIAFEDYAIIPLYWQKVHWAGKSNLDFIPNRGEDTLAVAVTPAQ